MTSGQMERICSRRKGEHVAYLLGPWVAVGGWAALYHVRDVDVLASQARKTQKAVELLAGSAHEGLALQVLVASWALADEHHARVWVADAKHQVGARLSQGAQSTVAQHLTDLLEGDLAGSLVIVPGNLHHCHVVLHISQGGTFPPRPRHARRQEERGARRRRRPPPRTPPYTYTLSSRAPKLQVTS